MESRPDTRSQPLRLLILGGGAIVTECHLPALRALGWMEGCEVIEPYARNAQAIQSRYPGVRVSSLPYEQVVTDNARLSTFDAALVALPNTLHLDATERCLAAGLPVLCEKPLALTSAGCLQAAAAARLHGKLAAVAMVRRFTPGLLALRESLHRGMIGDLVSITLEHGCSYSVWPSDTETVLRKDQGGCLVNMGIHFLDYLEWIFGALTPVQYSDDLAGGIEVNCDLQLQTASAVPVALRISWTHELSNVLHVAGTCGSLTMDLGKSEFCTWKSADGQIESVIHASKPFASGDWQPTFEACFVEQFYQFALAVRGVESAAPPVTPEHAAHSHELVEWAYQNRQPAVRRLPVPARPSLASASVVVTGGTGFIGSHLVERLAELEMKSILVPVRSFRSGAQVARFPATMQRVDLTSLDSCRQAFRGARHVFHLAYGTSGTNLAEFTVDSTRTVLQAALEEKVESVVVFSTCTVWAGYPEGVINEDHAFKPGMGGYGESKLKAHLETLEFARQHPGMRVTIIAPGAVYGPRSTFFVSRPVEAARAGQFAWYDGGRGICNYVHVSNLVDLAILAAQAPTAHGQTFIAVDGHATWREFLTPLVEPWLDRIPELSSSGLPKANSGPPRTGTLRDIARAMLNAPGVMAAISNHPLLGELKERFIRAFPDRHRSIQQWRPVPEFILKPSAPNPEVAPWVASMFGPDTVQFSSAKARRLLDWQPAIDLHQGLAGTVEWLREMRLRN